MIALQNPSIFFLKRRKWDYYKKPNYKPKRGISNLANNIAAAVKLLELKTDNFVELLHHSWQKLRAVLENYEKKSFWWRAKFSMGDAWFSSDLLENLGNIFFSLSFFHFVLDHFKEGGLEKRQNTVLASIIIIQAIITICFSLSSSAKHTFRGLYFNEGWKKCLLHIFLLLKI